MRAVQSIKAQSTQKHVNGAHYTADWALQALNLLCIHNVLHRRRTSSAGCTVSPAYSTPCCPVLKDSTFFSFSFCICMYVCMYKKIYNERVLTA